VWRDQKGKGENWEQNGKKKVVGGFGPESNTHLKRGRGLKRWYAAWRKRGKIRAGFRMRKKAHTKGGKKKKNRDLRGLGVREKKNKRFRGGGEPSTSVAK